MRKQPKKSGSPAQIAANRRNAQKSTGPRTEKGKRRSSLNGLIHGLNSKKFSLADLADETECASNRKHLGDVYKPQNDVERSAIEELAFSLCLNRHLRLISVKLIEKAAGLNSESSSPLNITSLVKLSQVESIVNRRLFQIVAAYPRLFYRTRARCQPQTEVTTTGEGQLNLFAS